MLRNTLKKYDISPTSYLGLILIHAFIGVAVFLVQPFSKVFYFAFLGYFFFRILKNPNKNFEILLACAYVVGSEVFVRMTGGALFYEAAKYEVIGFCLLGLFYSGFSRKGVIFFIYLFLLAPGIVVSSETLSIDADIRTAIAFNLSGPICLGISALFAYDKSITRSQLHQILLACMLPIFSMSVYLFLYSPDLRDVLSGTESNFAASGGFGPNQVATLLGLGIFLAFSRVLFFSHNKILFAVHLFVLALMGYRGLVTFSRGGILVGIIMIAALMWMAYRKTDTYNRQKLSFLVIVFGGVAFATWLYSSYQTGGLLDLRYAGKDAAGRIQEDYTTGRSALIETEFEAFITNPFLGIGVGKNKEYRLETEGVESASHNELSRLLAEHGLLGIMALMILLLTPLLYRLKNPKNLFFFSLFVFWFLTVNHSSMRLAAPAFIYALVFLDIRYEKHPLSRQPTV